MMTFDAAGRETCVVRESRTNTPLQALTLLNDQAYLEFAQRLAARILTECEGTDDERLAYAFRLCLARQPSTREQETLGRLLSQQFDSLRKNPDEARALASANLPENAEMPRYAAWTTVARVLLNLDEFITRE